jgi:hypothetical protein
LYSPAQTNPSDHPVPELAFERLLASLANRLWPQRPEGDSLASLTIRIRQALKARAHLIVIDNLESEADTAYLLEHLNDLAHPSKFLLTTRTRLPSHANGFSFPLDELGPTEASALLRHHARATGVHDLARLSKAEIKQVYQVVGGNPLAIKLVVGLATVESLPQILSDLARSRPGPIDDLYRHIYLKTWQTLSPEARALLQAMPLVTEPGGLVAQLQAISRLAEGPFWSALHELVARSLLEVRGTAQERRYGIHRLTETFLRTDIIDWPEQRD